MGQLIAHTNFNGNGETSFYDVFGRIATQKFYFANGTIAKVVVISYDALSWQTNIVELTGARSKRCSQN